MMIQNWCNGSVAMNIEARPGPDYKRSWSFHSTTLRSANTIRLTLNQTKPDGNGLSWLWGDLYLSKDYCTASAKLTPHILGIQSPANAFAITSGYDEKPDGSTATLTNLPTTLNPDPPRELQTTIRITGGPCDGQTFPVTLKSR
jgi:hypothetical protein